MGQQFKKWQHPAANTLTQLQCYGATIIISSTLWSASWKDEAVQHRLHLSATNLYHDFLLEEMQDMVQKGYWTVLPYSTNWHLPQLKISPAGVVRRGGPPMYSMTKINYNRLLLFKGQSRDCSSSTATSDTVWACTEANFRMNHLCPWFGLVHMIEIDLADGCYQVPLSTRGALQLTVILPGSPTQVLLIGILITLYPWDG